MSLGATFRDGVNPVALVEMLVKISLGEEYPAEARVAAAGEILARGWGSPPQFIVDRIQALDPLGLKELDDEIKKMADDLKNRKKPDPPKGAR